MGIRLIDIAVVVLHLIHYVYTEHILCNVTQLYSCPGLNHVCSQVTQQCECLEGFVSDGQDCVTVLDESSHDATAAVVSIFTIALVVVGLVLVIRKYNLIEYARQKINLRRNNDIMYEDVMIGQDDPPLVP